MFTRRELLGDSHLHLLDIEEQQLINHTEIRIEYSGILMPIIYYSGSPRACTKRGLWSTMSHVRRRQ